MSHDLNRQVLGPNQYSMNYNEAAARDAELEAVRVKAIMAANAGNGSQISMSPQMDKMYGGASNSPVAPPIAPIGGVATVPSAGGGGNVDPWSANRTQAGTKLAGMAQSDPSDYYANKLRGMTENGAEFMSTDPSYQWRFNQGQRAVERSLASKGLLQSGNAAIELQQYGQGAASQEYGAQYSRLLQGLEGVSKQYDTQMNRLMQMAGVAQDPATPYKLAIDAYDAQTRRQVAYQSQASQAAQNAIWNPSIL